MSSVRIRFLGTGNAFNTDGRGSQSLWLEAFGEAPLLVDAGPTALCAIERFGERCQRIDRLFVTHLHGDHTAGWPFLLLHHVFLDRRERPFEIHGPVGTRALLDGLAGHCYGELLEQRHHEIRYLEHEVTESRELDGGGTLRYDVLPMDHHESSIGYRFRWDGCSIAVSGDTRWSPELERLARGADLLVLECSSVEPSDLAHVSLGALRDGRSKLESGRIVLVHLDDAVAEALARDPLPGVVAAYDGLELTL